MTDTGVKRCRIPGDILYHPELTLPEKMLLGLVWSFSNGLRLSNGEIGRILCKHPDTVSRIIKKLGDGGWIKITANQSRWRRLYFDADVKVKEGSTLTFSGSTLTPRSTYSDPQVKQKGKGKKKGNFSFSDEGLPPGFPEPDMPTILKTLGYPAEGEPA